MKYVLTLTPETEAELSEIIAKLNGNAPTKTKKLVVAEPEKEEELEDGDGPTVVAPPAKSIKTAAPKSAHTPALTLANKIAKDGKGKREKVKKLIAKFEAASISDIEEEKLPAFMKALKALDVPEKAADEDDTDLS